MNEVRMKVCELVWLYSKQCSSVAMNKRRYVFCILLGPLNFVLTGPAFPLRTFLTLCVHTNCCRPFEIG